MPWSRSSEPDADCGAAPRQNGTVRTVEVAPVADVVDTTGAGDAFAAGYLSAWLAGGDAETSVRRGHSWAATVLGHAGAGGQRVPESATFAESQ